MIRVVVVEDEADLRDSVVKFLCRMGMNARGAADGRALTAELAREPADVVVLDVNLPGETGFALAARLRALQRIGVIMMTARTEVTDQIVGLSAGADSYLTKPVDLRVLEAAIRSLAGRLGGGHVAQTVAKPPGPWRLDAGAWSLISPEGRQVALSSNELRVLKVMSGGGDELVRREALFAALGKAGDIADGFSLNALLNRLRRKVEAGCGAPLPLKPIRAEGYVFAGGLQAS